MWDDDLPKYLNHDFGNVEVNLYLSQVEELKHKIIATKRNLHHMMKEFICMMNKFKDWRRCLQKKRLNLDDMPMMLKNYGKNSKITDEDKHWKEKGECSRMHCGLPLVFDVCCHHCIDDTNYYCFLRCTYSNCVVIKFKVVGLVFSYCKDKFVWTRSVMTLLGSGPY